MDQESEGLLFKHYCLQNLFLETEAEAKAIPMANIATWLYTWNVQQACSVIIIFSIFS